MKISSIITTGIALYSAFALTKKKQEVSKKVYVIFALRVDAEKVLDDLFSIHNKYGVVYPSDLYDCIGKIGSLEDDRYRWTNLSGTKIIRVREGYKLELPTPINGGKHI